MIAESPRIFLLFLVATTVLGAVMGFCIAYLRAKSRASTAISAVRVELAKQTSEAEKELANARRSTADLRAAVARHSENSSKSAQREEALDVHSQLQAQRIRTLEAQLATYEDQQIRLQRDFASYKSNKSRELELAKNKTGSWSEARNLPILSKRIDDDVGVDLDSYESPSVARETGSESSAIGSNTRWDRKGLSKPLSRELDIPALSESELPESVEELEFELVDLDGTGAWPRG